MLGHPWSGRYLLEAFKLECSLCNGFGTRLGRDALPQCCIWVALSRYSLAMRYCGALSQCSVAVLNRGALSRCVFWCDMLVRFAMRCRSALLRGGVAMQQCSSSSRFIILGHLCDVLSWGILRCFLKWGFGSKALCCNTFGCSAVYRDVWISRD